jgi:hypothetical protein
LICTALQHHELVWRAAGAARLACHCEQQSQASTHGLNCTSWETIPYAGAARRSRKIEA